MWFTVSVGICDASMFMEVKDPETNQTISVWVPISRVVVNNEMTPPTAYFIAQNNVTVSKYTARSSVSADLMLYITIDQPDCPHGRKLAKESQGEGFT